MKQYKVGILGATGSVGREMMKLLLEREFPVSELHLFASERSAGKVVAWNSKPIQIELAADDAFEGLDIVLGAAENEVAKRFAPAIVKAGAVFIDNSSAFRLREDVPLVVPEVNPEDVKLHRGIIANPNCSTVIAVTALNGLKQLSPIVSIVASTYQAVSGAGAAGPVELSEQTAAVMKGQPVQAKVFPHQIAFNLIPQIGGEQESGYTSEEMKLQYEGRKILHLPQMKVSCTCVRVPVMRSHSISLNVKFQRRPSVYEARRALQFAPGCKLVDDLAEGQYPMPLDSSDQDLVLVGRIRPDLTDDDGLCLWCCGDQVRKGAATNAIQIAELLIAE
ncbi:MAG: aspartate-semialdehyde dehydrogenase [Oscillospiraceae bacterium]|nr:aspartate-semialdehyde dehydrogenase [Oscillospiraceae bacterium]